MLSFYAFTPCSLHATKTWPVATGLCHIKDNTIKERTHGRKGGERIKGLLIMLIDYPSVYWHFRFIYLNETKLIATDTDSAVDLKGFTLEGFTTTRTQGKVRVAACEHLESTESSNAEQTQESGPAHSCLQQGGVETLNRQGEMLHEY